MKDHFKRWGAIWILVALWLGSSVGQYFSQLEEIQLNGMTEFWAATFENWQSEFLQLAVQGLLIVGAAKYLFRKGEEDADELKRKIEELREEIRNK